VWGLLVSRPLFSFLQPPIRIEPHITFELARWDAPAGLIRSGAHSSGHARTRDLAPLPCCSAGTCGWLPRRLTKPRRHRVRQPPKTHLPRPPNSSLRAVNPQGAAPSPLSHGRYRPSRNCPLGFSPFPFAPPPISEEKREEK
jgi:hypothetical protein